MTSDKPNARAKQFRRRLLLGALLGCAGIGLYAFLRPSALPPFVRLTSPIKLPVLARDRLELSLPNTSAWGWVRQGEEWMLGKRKPLMIESRVLVLADSSPAIFSQLALDTPNFSEPYGFKVWLLSAEKMKALAARLKQLPGIDVQYGGTINTADGISSSLSFGNTVPLNGSNSWVGMTLGCWANLHSDSTDLIAQVHFSELVTNTVAGLAGASLSHSVSLQTNLDTAVRMQIPKGSGIFLMDDAPATPGRKRAAAILELSRPKT